MMQFEVLGGAALEVHPFRFAEVGGLYPAEGAAELARTYPRDKFKVVKGDDGEKSYEYWARSLIRMGAAAPSHAEGLSDAWRELASDLLSPAYRSAVSTLTGLALHDAPIEVNVFHYGPGAWLGPHLDLADKLVTHVLYFNDSWNNLDGGCLQILDSKDPAAVVRQVSPLVGNSAVLVRSESSWHAVAPVVPGSSTSRRSVTVTLYAQGSTSSMWPEDDRSPLRDYNGEKMGLAAEPPSRQGVLGRLLARR